MGQPNKIPSYHFLNRDKQMQFKLPPESNTTLQGYQFSGPSVHWGNTFLDAWVECCVWFWFEWFSMGKKHHNCEHNCEFLERSFAYFDQRKRNVFFLSKYFHVSRAPSVKPVYHFQVFFGFSMVIGLLNITITILFSIFRFLHAKWIK